MSAILRRIQELVARGELRISDHGYDEIVEDELSARELVAGVAEAEVVEDNPDFAKGPCVLVLQRDEAGQPVHVVWGIPAGHAGPAVLVTAYRPDPARWSDNFHRRL